MRFPILVPFALAAFVAAAAAQPPLAAEPTPTRRPAIERCAEFCAVFFESGSRERAECVNGCADAESCTKVCDERFEDHPGKHTACFKRCMRSKAT